MPSPAPSPRQNLDVLTQDVLALLMIWTVWTPLFRNPDPEVSERRYALMKSYPPIEPFFAIVQATLVSEVILGLSRLLDNKREILGLKTLVAEIAILDSAEQQLANDLLEKARVKHERANDLRHRFLAHRNLDFATTVKEEAEVSVLLSDVEQTLDLVTQFLDIYQRRVNGKTVEWIDLSEDHALPVEILLEDAQSFRQLPFAER